MLWSLLQVYSSVVGSLRRDVLLLSLAASGRCVSASPAVRHQLRLNTGPMGLWLCLPPTACYSLGAQVSPRANSLSVLSVLYSQDSSPPPPPNHDASCSNQASRCPAVLQFHHCLGWPVATSQEDCGSPLPTDARLVIGAAWVVIHSSLWSGPPGTSVSFRPQVCPAATNRLPSDELVQP